VPSQLSISITEGDIIAAQVALGDTRQASARFDSLIDRARTGYVLPSSMAAAAGYLGRTDEAFEWLERAFREGACRLRTFPHRSATRAAT